MKNLKEFIVEGIFDVDDNIDNVDKNIKDQIKQFLKNNFNGISSCKISRKPNTEGKFEVSSSKDIRAKTCLTSLTNGLFVWTTVGGNFFCRQCHSLKSLKGSPEKVGGNFSCSWCYSLKSLEGAPKEVDGFFSCSECGITFTIDDVKEVSKVRGKIYTQY